MKNNAAKVIDIRIIMLDEREVNASAGTVVKKAIGKKKVKKIRKAYGYEDMG